MACSEEEVGKNLEAVGNKDGRKKRQGVQRTIQFTGRETQSSWRHKMCPDVRQWRFLTSYLLLFPEEKRS